MKPQRILLAILLVAACFALVSGAAAQEYTGNQTGLEQNQTPVDLNIPNQTANMTIPEAVNASGNFSILVRALQATGLNETLSQEGPYTLFAPTDEAFQQLPPGTLEALLANATPGNATANVTLPPATGNQSGNATGGDMISSIIGAIMNMLPGGNVAGDNVTGNQTTGNQTPGNATGNLTVNLTELLLHHVVPGAYNATELANLSSVQTLYGANLTVNSTDGNLTVNNATVIVPDIPAENGIIHGIDAVLIPTVSGVPVLTITEPQEGANLTGDTVPVAVNVTNFSLVDRLGEVNVPGEGHLHYYLDAPVPTEPGQPAITAVGRYVPTVNTSYTFENVTSGEHNVSVQLVNNDHTPLIPLVYETVNVTVEGVAPNVTPTETPMPNQTTPAPGGATTIDLVAEGIAFDQDTITVPAGAEVTMNFENRDAGIFHNVAVYTTAAATEPIFVGEVITGVDSITYTFTAPEEPGTYFFRCDVHPVEMTGDFVVE